MLVTIITNIIDGALTSIWLLNDRIMNSEFFNGICCFFISFILAILWNPIVLLAGVMLFVVFAVTEQDTIKSRANDMRTQIQDDLPRFLDLLKTELSIGSATR